MQRDSVAGDRLTIISVALIAYMLMTVLHEGVGHGIACLATGGQIILLNTVSVDCSADNRLVIAAGSIMNLIAAAIFFALGRMTSRTAPEWKFLFWLSMTINLFTPAGYIAFSGIGGFGDWALFIRGLPAQWAWRIGMIAAGVAAYLAIARFGAMELRPLIGSDKDLGYSRAIELTRPPYFAGGILSCVAGALNPQGWILVALSAAAATFGGTSGLLWMMDGLKRGSLPLEAGPEPIPIRRSWGWITAAGAGAIVFIFVLGPGLRFASKSALGHN